MPTSRSFPRIRNLEHLAYFLKELRDTVPCNEECTGRTTGRSQYAVDADGTGADDKNTTSKGTKSAGFA